MIDLNTLQRAVDHSPASFVIFDRDGRIEYVNAAFETVTGRTAADMIGRHAELLVSVESTDGKTDLSQALLRGRAWKGERATRHGSGDERWERVSIWPVQNSAGAITHFVGVMEDVTDERAAHEEMRRNEERFDLAMRGASDGLWDWDLRTNAVYYSPRWKSMLGYTIDEVDSSLDEFARLVHPTDYPRAMAAVKGYLDGASDRYEVQLRMQHKAGHYLHVLARGFAARDASGVPYRLVGTHVDISEQKRVEQVLAAQSAATLVLATPTSLMETLPRFLRAVGEAGHWSVGCVWSVDASADALRCLTLWHATDIVRGDWHSAIRAMAVERGASVAGTAWAQNLPTWSAGESLSNGDAPAAALDMKCTFAVPLAFDGRTVGVVQFYARDIRPRDDRWFRMFDNLYALARQLVQRRRMERSPEEPAHEALACAKGEM